MPRAWPVVKGQLFYKVFVLLILAGVGCLVSVGDSLLGLPQILRALLALAWLLPPGLLG